MGPAVSEEGSEMVQEGRVEMMGSGYLRREREGLRKGRAEQSEEN